MNHFSVSVSEIIEDIFTNIDDLIIGKMVCGAGGGGFLQIILKENITKEDLKNRIELIYPNTNIKVYDVTLIQ